MRKKHALALCLALLLCCTACGSRSGQAAAAGESGSAQAGESLWQYANRWGLSIEKLVEANPHIRDICALEEGEKVMLP